MRKRFVSLFVVAAFFFVGHVASVANAFSDVYVFGDSLSDAGALAVLSPANCPPPPYAGCRFSNGPVWVENLASRLGLSASTACAGGTNYAIGGQRSDQILGGQIPLFSSHMGGVADSSALYVIWGAATTTCRASTRPPPPTTSSLQCWRSRPSARPTSSSRIFPSSIPSVRPSTRCWRRASPHCLGRTSTSSTR